MIFLYISGILSFIYGVSFADIASSGVRTILKTSATVCLALFATSYGAPTALIVALLLSSAGDFFISQDKENSFLYGLISFALAHISYIILFAHPVSLPHWGISAGMGFMAVCMLWILIPHAKELKYL